MARVKNDTAYIATDEGVDDYINPTEASHYGRIIKRGKEAGGFWELPTNLQQDHDILWWLGGHSSAGYEGLSPKQILWQLQHEPGRSSFPILGPNPQTSVNRAFNRLLNAGYIEEK